MNRTVRTVLVYAIVIVVAIMAVNAFVGSATAPEEITLNDLEDRIAAGQVESVVIKQKSNVIEGQMVSGVLAGGGTDFKTSYTEGYEGDLTSLLLANGIEAEMLRFPGETHELSRSGKPRHRRERFEAILDWHGRYLALDATDVTT